MKDIRGQLEKLLAERILVLDGAWGVLIHRRVLSVAAYRGERFADHPRDLRGDPDLLNLTRPDIVLDIHRAYFEAGADITTTNTFTATIFYHDEAQKRLAEASKAALDKTKPFKEPIVTPVQPAGEFWPDEDYHQDFYKKNPVRYKYYRTGCGRDERLKQLWGKAPD